MDSMEMEMNFKIGDKVYCDSRKMYGHITRVNPLGLVKSKALGVQWDNKCRDIIFGNEKCCKLQKVN